MFVFRKGIKLSSKTHRWIKCEDRVWITGLDKKDKIYFLRFSMLWKNKTGVISFLQNSILVNQENWVWIDIYCVPNYCIFISRLNPSSVYILIHQVCVYVRLYVPLKGTFIVIDIISIVPDIYSLFQHNYEDMQFWCK